MSAATARNETALRDQRIHALIAEGLTLRDIAGRLALSPTHVARLVKALGLKVRKRKAVRSQSIAYSRARAELSHVERKLSGAAGDVVLGGGRAIGRGRLAAGRR